MLLVEEVRLARDALRYGYAVGKVRVLETKRLDSGTLERLLDAPTFAEQKRLIAETPYARFLEHAQTAEQVEAGLSEALESFYGFLDDAALPPEVTYYFRLRYDFANLKGVAKARLLGSSAEGLLSDHGSVPLDDFRGDLTLLPQTLSTVAASVMATGADDSALADAMLVDTTIDKAMFAELLATAKAAHSEFLADLARLAIDLANIKTLVRARRAGHGPSAIQALLIDGGSVPLSALYPLAGSDAAEISAAISRNPAMRSLSAADLGDSSTLDVTLDTVTSAALKRGGRGAVSSEPVIGYVFAREAEVAVLRLLLLGKLSGLSQEAMRRRVRAIG